jgi:hypothetical protein
MPKLTFPFIFLTIVICSCSGNVPTQNHPPKFRTFEMSYTNGWAKDFSFFVDSNKIFFSPYNIDSTYYGVLPDSIFSLIDSFVFNLSDDTTMKSNDNTCFDCSVVAIQIVTKIDTTRINQTRNIDKAIWIIVNSLQSFIDNGKHNKINSLTFLETRNIIKPLPPKIFDKKSKPK